MRTADSKSKERTQKLVLSPDTLKKLLDFSKGELMNIGDLSRLLGVGRDTIERWSVAGGFPSISSIGNLGWRYVGRQDIAQWLAKFNINTEKYITRGQQWFSTRELADELNLNVTVLIGLLARGIVKPVPNSSPSLYVRADVETLKAYMAEQAAKEEIEKQKMKDFLAMKGAGWDKVREDQAKANKIKDDARAEIEARRKAGLAQQVEDYRKSLQGG